MATTTAAGASLSTFQRVMLSIILLEIPLRLDVHLGYHEAEAAYGALGGWNISLTTLCLGMLYGAWLVKSSLHQIRPESWWPRGIVPGLCYLGAMSLSVIVALQPVLAMIELFAMLQAFLIFLYLFRWIRCERDLRFVVGLLLIGMVLQGIFMLGLSVLGHSIKLGPIQGRWDLGGRVGGTVGSPNEAASYLTLLLPLALGVIVAGWNQRSRLLATAAFLTGSMAIVTTHSRGGWIGTVLGVLIVVGLSLVRRRISLVVPVALGLAALVVGVLFQDVIVKRFTKDDNGSAYSRVTLTKVAMRVVAESPTLGSGANNMAVAVKPHACSPDFRGTWGFVTHNRHLRVWAETGIVGLVTWLAFLLTALVRGWRAWCANDPFLSPLALGAAAGMVGVILHMSVEVFGGRTQMQILWVLAALTAVLYRMTVYNAPANAKVAHVS